MKRQTLLLGLAAVVAGCTNSVEPRSAPVILDVTVGPLRQAITRSTPDIGPHGSYWNGEPESVNALYWDDDATITVKATDATSCTAEASQYTGYYGRPEFRFPEVALSPNANGTFSGVIPTDLRHYPADAKNPDSPHKVYFGTVNLDVEVNCKNGEVSNTFPGRAYATRILPAQEYQVRGSFSHIGELPLLYDPKNTMAGGDQSTIVAVDSMSPNLFFGAIATPTGKKSTIAAKTIQQAPPGATPRTYLCGTIYLTAKTTSPRGSAVTNTGKQDFYCTETR